MDAANKKILMDIEIKSRLNHFLTAAKIIYHLFVFTDEAFRGISLSFVH